MSKDPQMFSGKFFMNLASEEFSFYTNNPCHGLLFSKTTAKWWKHISA